MGWPYSSQALPSGPAGLSAGTCRRYENSRPDSRAMGEKIAPARAQKGSRSFAEAGAIKCFGGLSLRDSTG